MGIFNCISEGCVEVRWKPYRVTGGLKYRYEGENWIKIDGDNYELINNTTIRNLRIINFDIDRVVYKYNNGRVTYVGTHTINVYINFVNDKSTAFLPVLPYNDETFVLGSHTVAKRMGILHRATVRPDLEPDFGFVHTSKAFTNSRGDNRYGLLPSTARNYAYRDKVEISTGCTFKVYKQGRVIHEETRADCPEVETVKGECELSDRTEVVQINKLPYLQRVDVVPYAFQNALGLLTQNDYGNLVVQDSIPNECLNIYKNYTTSIPPELVAGFAPSNSAQASYEFIAQICSGEGCPPPEYEVVCNCIERCPSGTCEVECGSVICCYDPATGVAVDQISRGGER